MKIDQGFWAGMSAGLRVKFVLTLVFLLAAGAVLAWSPIAGIVLLMLPLLWSVLVTWFGSESGRGYGPYSLSRETALTYTLRHIWASSGLVKWGLSLAATAIVISGLGWISTENFRNHTQEPGLTERAVSTADRAAEKTKQTASDWFSTAKGWFTPDEQAE